MPGQPSLGEREVAEGLLDRAARQRIRWPGLVILADKGLAGRAFAPRVAALDVALVRPDRADEPTRFGNLGGVRQWIEAIIWTLNDQLSLEGHGAHTIQGCGSGSPSGCSLGGQRLVQLAAGSTGQAFSGRLRPLTLPTNRHQ